MQDFLLEYYFWIKALHIIAVICWMAGLLYLPRLFVYHSSAEKSGELSETLKIMEHKLLRYIMNPAMIAVYVFAGLMIYANPSLFSEGWMHVKLLMITLLTVYHHVLGRQRKTFLKDENKKDHKYYRWQNEIPTVLMIVSVIMAVVKPF